MAESLREWYISYIKNRDIMIHKIASIDESADRILIHNKDGLTESTVIAEVPSSFTDLLSSFSPDERITLVALNKSDLISLMIQEWDKLATYKGLSIMFVNMNSQLEKRWIIKPYVHNSISDRSSLKTGIMSIAGNVEFC